MIVETLAASRDLEGRCNSILFYRLIFSPHKSMWRAMTLIE